MSETSVGLSLVSAPSNLLRPRTRQEAIAYTHHCRRRWWWAPSEAAPRGPRGTSPSPSPPGREQTSAVTGSFQKEAGEGMFLA